MQQLVQSVKVKIESCCFKLFVLRKPNKFVDQLFTILLNEASR